MPPCVTADPPDSRTEEERLLDEELEKLLSDEPAPEENGEITAILDEGTTTKAPASRLAGRSAPDENTGPSELRGHGSSLKTSVFEPTTRMEGGKAKWGRARFVATPHALVVHKNFAELSGRASKLLLAMQSQYVGSNNGHLTATFSRMKRFGFNSKDSLAKSIQELIMLGYIVRTRSQQRRMPALYALTWLPINKAPTGEPFDSGIGPEGESSDLWRHVDLSAEKRTGGLH